MVRILLPDRPNPGSVQGTRLNGRPPDITGPARALGRMGEAFGRIAEDYEADQQRMAGYQANLALERWTNDEWEAYGRDFESTAPDGSDFLKRREEALKRSYQTVRRQITDPELQAKADMVFERTRGQQMLKGVGEVKQKRFNYVSTTTGEGVDRSIASGQLSTSEQYNDYFENVVRPKIDTVITDPAERQQLYETFGKRLAEDFLSRNPQVALPKSGDLAPGLHEAIVGASTAHGVDPTYLSRLAWIESRGGRDLQARASSAKGPFQFIDATARTYGLSNPLDFGASADAAARLTNDNRSALRTALGREPTGGELYLAHQQGAQGAINLLTRPDMLATDIVGEDAVRLNGGSPHMTAGEFAGLWIAKFNGTRVPTATEFVAKPQGGMWDYVTPADWRTATERAVKFESEFQQREDAARVAEGAALKSKFDLEIEKGSIANPNQFLDDPRLDDNQKAQLLNKWKAENKNSLDLTSALQAYSSGAPFNPYDSDSRRQVDLIGNAAVKAANGDPEQEKAIAAEIAERTGMVPQVAFNRLRGAAGSTDPSVVAQALAEAGDLEAKAPNALSSRDGGEAVSRDAGLFRHYVYDLGLEPEEAARRILEGRDPAKQREVASLSKKADDITGRMDVGDVVSLFNSPWWPGGASAGYNEIQAETMLSDYKGFFRERYFQTGNEDAAKSMAARDLQRIYGVSEVTGSEVIMRYPPEKFYPQVGGSHDYLKRQILEDARQASGLDLQEGDAFLLPDVGDAVGGGRTAAAIRANQMPPYLLFYYRDEGGQRIIEQVPGRYFVPDLKRAETDLKTEFDRKHAEARGYRNPAVDLTGILGGYPMQKDQERLVEEKVEPRIIDAFTRFVPVTSRNASNLPETDKSALLSSIIASGSRSGIITFGGVSDPTQPLLDENKVAAFARYTVEASGDVIVTDIVSTGNKVPRNLNSGAFVAADPDAGKGAMGVLASIPHDRLKRRQVRFKLGSVPLQ